MSALKPLGSHVLIRRSEATDTSAGGIILPEAAKEQPKEGTVLAIGAGKVVDDGSRSTFQVAEGDRVIFSSYAGTEVEHDGETLMLMDESDILAVVK
jgi:chaperonin GroES